MNGEDWVDKKWFKYIAYALTIAGAILGAFIGKSVWERLGLALLGALMSGVISFCVLPIPIEFVEMLLEWLKARSAKGIAYYVIDSNRGRLYRTEEPKTVVSATVVSALKKWNDREAIHLLNDLYDLEHTLEQMPEVEDEEEEDQEDSLSINFSRPYGRGIILFQTSFALHLFYLDF